MYAEIVRTETLTRLKTKNLAITDPVDVTNRIPVNEVYSSELLSRINECSL